jgi:RNA polymerase sigma-70 factor (ECF subfamily)
MVRQLFRVQRHEPAVDVEPEPAPDAAQVAAAGAGESGVDRPVLAPVIHLAHRPVELRAWDGPSIVRLYEEESVDLFRFILASVRDRAQAEDILQEAFLRLVREGRRGRLPDNPRGWLYRVSVNLVISRARRVRTAERGAIATRPAEAVGSPEDAVVDAERHAALRDALLGLPADARLALVMAAKGYSAREIGDALGRSEGAVRSLTCRARIQLRQRLAEPTVTVHAG